MSEVSKHCELRVTECTVLTRCNSSHSEIMAVSSHKSVQSLAVYQKTKDKQKIQMGKALFQLMIREEDMIDITNKQPIQDAEKKALPALTPNEHIMAAAESELAIIPVQQKENAAPQVIPFEPNF